MIIPIKTIDSSNRYDRIGQGRQIQRYNGFHPYDSQERGYQMNGRQETAWDEESVAHESLLDSERSSDRDIRRETIVDDAEAWHEVTEEKNDEKDDASSVLHQLEAETASVTNGGALDNWQERYIRLRADFDNYKRHAEEEKSRRISLGKEAVLDDIFPLVEHMERALKASREEDDGSAILQGVEMVYNELLSVLEKHGVDRIKTVGQPFDPNVHEALAVTPYSGCPEDTIVEEIRAGFMKSGKLLRPASVVVAKEGT